MYLQISSRSRLTRKPLTSSATQSNLSSSHTTSPNFTKLLFKTWNLSSSQSVSSFKSNKNVKKVPNIISLTLCQGAELLKLFDPDCLNLNPLCIGAGSSGCSDCSQAARSGCYQAAHWSCSTPALNFREASAADS